MYIKVNRLSVQRDLTSIFYFINAVSSERIILFCIEEKATYLLFLNLSWGLQVYTPKGMSFLL